MFDIRLPRYRESSRFKPTDRKLHAIFGEQLARLLTCVFHAMVNGVSTGT